MARILLASEDFALTQHIQNTLEGDGHGVVLVTNGLDAYTRTIAEQPELVLLDAVLPVHSGFETCRMIRDDPEAPPALPILILTGADVDPRKLEQAGAAGEIDRDIASVALRETIVNVLCKR